MYDYYIRSKTSGLWLCFISEDCIMWVDSIERAQIWKGPDSRDAALAIVVERDGGPGGSTNPYPEDRPRTP